jgi:hypothetical protein
VLFIIQPGYMREIVVAPVLRKSYNPNVAVGTGRTVKVSAPRADREAKAVAVPRPGLIHCHQVVSATAGGHVPLGSGNAVGVGRVPGLLADRAVEARADRLAVEGARCGHAIIRPP